MLQGQLQDVCGAASTAAFIAADYTPVCHAHRTSSQMATTTTAPPFVDTASLILMSPPPSLPPLAAAYQPVAVTPPAAALPCSLLGPAPAYIHDDAQPCHVTSTSLQLTAAPPHNYLTTTKIRAGRCFTLQPPAKFTPYSRPYV